MNQCENCKNVRFRKGACRGSMDCDPDEYWCAAGNDDILCCDDIEELYEYYKHEGEDLQDFIDRFDCPDFKSRRES